MILVKNKIYVVISVPLIGQEYDMYIPVVKKIGVIKELIIKLVEEMSDFNFVDDGCKKLYDKSSGALLDDNQFVKHSVIRNGSKLILF